MKSRGDVSGFDDYEGNSSIQLSTGVYGMDEMDRRHSRCLVARTLPLNAYRWTASGLSVLRPLQSLHVHG